MQTFGLKVNDVRKLRMTNGKTVEQTLLQEAERLKSLIEKHLRDYRRAFNPQRYKRTGDLENSVRIKTSIKLINGKPTALVYFGDNSTRRSGYGVWSNDGRGKYDDPQDRDDSIDLVPLLNGGYVVHKPVWFQDYENFGFRSGNGFLDKAIAEFNATNSLGIVLDWHDVIQGNFANW